ncbi:MAG: FHA domain-containing protein [Thermoanaerobaculia bacterium]|nr:FHA domain-containing protein [Thermoanaerobaculia bacterium]
MPVRLTLHHLEQPATTCFLREPGGYLLGRDPSCDVVLDDLRVSRRHARLVVTEDGGELRDLGSKNGVSINGHTVARGALPAAGWLSFGGLIARCEAGPGVARRSEDDERLTEASRRGHRLLADAGSEIDPLLDRLLTTFLEVSQTRRGFVLIADAQDDFEVVACHGLTPGDLTGAEFSGSLSTVQRVLSEATPLASSDTREDAALSGRPSIVREQIRALVCVPLVAADRTLGAVYADSPTPGKAFRELDLQILSALGDHAALALWLAGLEEELQGVAAGLPTRAERASRLAQLGFPSGSALLESGAAASSG